MERGVAIVCEVWVLQALRVALDDASEKGEVFEVDGSADADGDVSPTLCQESLVGMLGMADSHTIYSTCISGDKAFWQAHEHGGGRTIRMQRYYFGKVNARRDVEAHC